MYFAFFGIDGRIETAVNDSTVDEIPSGAVELSDEQWEDRFNLLLDKGVLKSVPFVPQRTADEIMQAFTTAIQHRLDVFARTRNYDGILSACTYATSLIPKFKAEGQYAVEARDNTWAAAYELLAEVEAGTRSMPTLDEVIAALPALVWPQ